MSPPEQWRFQWPDGTWIRWNPDTEAWEKEVPDADGEPRAAEATDIAPEERWLLDNLEPPVAPADDVLEEEGSVSGSITVGPGFAISRADEAEAAEADDEAEAGYVDEDEDEDWEDDDDEDVALGPRRSAAHVISTEGEEPKSSLRPTIIAGAGVGLAVGIVVSMMLR